MPSPLAARVPPLSAHLQHVDGRAESGDGTPLTVTTPITGETLVTAGTSGRDDVVRAVRVARATFERGDWRRQSGRARSQVLRGVADGVLAAQETLVELIVLDNGKTVGEATIDVHAAAAAFRWGAECAERGVIEERPPERGVQKQIAREPVGVVAAITPFNAPLPFAAVKLAPALAAGNSVVLKPSERAPLLPARLFDILTNAGVPRGVVGLLQGCSDVARHLAEHPDVNLISLTGGSEAGQAVLRASAATFARTLLELGGKSAQVVLADADLDVVVPALAGGIFKNAGQRCLSGSRIVIDRRVADEVEARVSAIADRLVVGDPFDPATHVGAMIDDRAVADAVAFVARAVADGTPVVAGGRAVDALRPGSFFRPTVLTGATRSSFAAQTELFGPVATVIRVDGIDEAIAVANDSRYGLTGAVWTRDPEAGARVASSLRAGYVWVNTFSAIFGDMPFGGFKASGIGREAGVAGFEAYTELKSILTDTTGGTTALRFGGV